MPTSLNDEEKQAMNGVGHHNSCAAADIRVTAPALAAKSQPTKGDRMDPSGSEMVNAVLEMAEADETLDEGAELLVLAALDGGEALDGVIAEGAAREPVSSPPEKEATNPVGAFLRSLRVQGFRGIGPPATLSLQPTPGLTIIAGRNGSGKSSFSEALELALTGDTYRWSSWVKKSALWSDHWRNLHHGQPCEIRVDVAEEGRGKTVVGVDWADGAQLSDRKTWVRRQGKPRENGLESLGWSRAVGLYRPILSYEELGGILQAGPSTLFDKLDAILGVDRVNEAHGRLTRKAKELQTLDADAKRLAWQLKKSLPDVTDERATPALTQLSKHKPDIEAVLALAVGSDKEARTVVTELEVLATIPLPEREEVTRTAHALRDAATEFQRLGSASLDSTARRAELLKQALDFHDHAGDAPCPVCGGSVLDTAWRARVEQELAQENAEMAERRGARRQLETARREATQVVDAVVRPASPAGVELPAVAEADAVWVRWTQRPADDLVLADHLETVFGELEVAYELLRQDAGCARQEHEDEWAPFALQLAEWTSLAQRASEKAPVVARMKAVTDFMKRALGELREQALVHIEEDARRIWAALKQESNVGLGGISLTRNRQPTARQAAGRR